MKIYVGQENDFRFKTALDRRAERWQDVGDGHVAFPVRVLCQEDQVTSGSLRADEGDLIVLTTRKADGAQSFHVDSCHIKDGKPMVLSASECGMQTLWLADHELFTSWGSNWDMDEMDWKDDEVGAGLVDAYGSLRSDIGYYNGQLAARRELWKEATATAAAAAGGGGAAVGRKRVRAKDAVTNAAAAERESARRTTVAAAPTERVVYAPREEDMPSGIRVDLDGPQGNSIAIMSRLYRRFPGMKTMIEGMLELPYEKVVRMASVMDSKTKFFTRDRELAERINSTV